MMDFDNVDDGSFNTNMLNYMKRRHAELGSDTLGQTYQRVAEDVIELVKSRKITCFRRKIARNKCKYGVF